MGWDEMKMYRERSKEMFDDFNEDELEKAYKKGCEHGYRKAMEEVGGGYGEREGGFGGRSWTISEGDRKNYGHRDREDYAERRYRDSMGRYR